MLQDILSHSKKKAVKELTKKLHELDKPGSTLERAVVYYFEKMRTAYLDRFNMWRMVNFQGGFLSELAASSKGTRDPVIESIYKGTEIVEEEQTAAKSNEKR